MPHISKSLTKASCKDDSETSHSLKPGVAAYEQAYEEVFVAGQVGNCYDWLLKTRYFSWQEAACGTAALTPAGAGMILMDIHFCRQCLHPQAACTTETPSSHSSPCLPSIRESPLRCSDAVSTSDNSRKPSCPSGFGSRLCRCTVSLPKLHHADALGSRHIALQLCQPELRLLLL